ncbi:MAG: carboxypeptidase-like regulatory domain-containing protein [Terriglobia bacterium]
MRKQAVSPWWVVIVALNLAVPSLSYGQAVAGAQIHGTINDPSGGAVPNAQVTVTQVSMGLVRTTRSDNTGLYLLTDLPVGPYELEVSASGFRKYVQSGIIFRVGDI